MRTNILRNGYLGLVRQAPFAHLLIVPALPADAYDALERDLPPQEEVYTRYRHPWAQAPADTAPFEDMPELGPWAEFWRAHLCQSFLDHLNAYWAGLLFPGQKVEAIEGLLSSSRRRFSEDQLATRPHCHHGDARDVELRPLVYLFLYMRAAGDCDQGGELRLHVGGGEKRKDLAAAAVAVTLPYAANTVAVFANGPRSIHSVSPRKSRWPRRNVMLTAIGR